MRGQRTDEAMTELAAAAAADPDNPRYLYVHSIALNSTGQVEASIQLLKRGVEAFPADFDIGWALVTILRDEGQTEEARAYANRLLERFPQIDSVRQLVASL